MPITVSSDYDGLWPPLPSSRPITVFSPSIFTSPSLALAPHGCSCGEPWCKYLQDSCLVHFCPWDQPSQLSFLEAVMCLPLLSTSVRTRLWKSRCWKRQLGSYWLPLDPSSPIHGSVLSSNDESSQSKSSQSSKIGSHMNK